MSWSCDTSGFEEEIEALLETAEKMHDAAEETLAEIGSDTYNKVISSMSRAFSDTSLVAGGTRVSKVYDTSSGDVKVFVGFFGYGNNASGNKVPIPLVAYARESGTSRGEKAVKFFKKSFPKKSELEQKMQAKLDAKGVGQ